MSGSQDPKDSITRRLFSAAHRDLTPPGYREELQRERELLNVISTSEVNLQTEACPSLIKEESPEQQECSPGLDQEGTKPTPIKEEQDELWSHQEGEELEGREEADTTKLPFTVVTVKSEDDEEEPQCSQLHQRQTEWMETREDCGGSEQSSNSDPEMDLQPEIEVKIEDSSEPETEDGDDYWESRDHQAGVNPLENMTDSIDKLHTCYECGKTFKRKGHLTAHMIVHTGEKPFSCSECGKSFNCKGNLTKHMIIHTGEKPYSCSVCGRTFNCRGSMTRHMLVHVGEKSFSCSECEKIFKSKGSLTQHMSVHKGEKSFSCSECGKIFKSKGNLTQHMSVHSGDKPFSCTVCGKRLKGRYYLAKHMRNHTREKPLSPSECDINSQESPTVHMEHHGEETPYIVVEIC